MPRSPVISIRADRVVLPDIVTEAAAILVDGGRIAAVDHAAQLPAPPGALRLNAPIVMPGFIDMHTHGARGHAFDASPADAREVARAIAADGVTTCYAGLGAGSSFERLRHTVAATAEAAGDTGGARLEGIFLEAPYINPARHGAWPPAHLRPPDVDELHRLADAAGTALKRVNVAPELPGALDFIRAARELGIVVSVGHSDATYEEALAAVEAGATITNHTYNAMSPLGHRSPGLVGATLTEHALLAELIFDEVHVHPAAALALFRARGPEGVALITDNIPMAGLPDGVYTAGRREFHVGGGACRLADGTLAGSTVGFDQCVRNAARRFELTQDLPALARLAATNAAVALGIGAETGSITPGRFADLVLLDESLVPQATIVRGELVFQRKDPHA